VGSQSPPPPQKKVPEKRTRVSRKDFDVHDLSGVAEPKLVCNALVELPVAPKGRDAAGPASASSLLLRLNLLVYEAFSY
jgi:hypothetical protein